MTDESDKIFDAASKDLLKSLKLPPDPEKGEPEAEEKDDLGADSAAGPTEVDGMAQFLREWPDVKQKIDDIHAAMQNFGQLG